MNSEHTALEVLYYAAVYRSRRHESIEARLSGDASAVARAAASAGVALRRMRRAAAEHNRGGVRVAA